MKILFWLVIVESSIILLHFMLSFCGYIPLAIRNMRRALGVTEVQAPSYAIVPRPPASDLKGVI